MEHPCTGPDPDFYGWPIVGRHAFARDSAGDLILYAETPIDSSTWQHENISARFPAGPKIVGTPRPVASVNPIRTDVFGRSPTGELIHYWWTFEDEWSVENLTTGPNAALPAPPLLTNPTFVSEPAVVATQNGYLRHDVFARDGLGHLIHYGEYLSGWQSQNLTVNFTGPTIAGTPAVMTEYYEPY